MSSHHYEDLSYLSKYKQSSDIRGSLNYHHQFASRYVKPKRNIIVYLPPGYHLNPQKKYPVVYMHDGNNLFDPQTAFMGRDWQMAQAAERLIFNDGIEPFIIVGISNTADRFEEYTWHPALFQEEIYGGWGLLYAHFVVKELKPFIDQNYRTLWQREHTTMMGSSLGAIISFYIAREYPRVFSKIGMLSPTIYWAEHRILEDTLSFPTSFKVWVDIGTEEGTNIHTEETVESTLSFIWQLEAIGYRQFKNLGFYIDWGAGHDEYAWRKRMDKIVKFLFRD